MIHFGLDINNVAVANFLIDLLTGWDKISES